MPARDFGALVNISRQTLYAWKRRFEELGPAGLMDRPKGVKQGSKLPELTKRTILMLKQSHPDWGCERISDMLVRGPALPASANAVARVLREAGYELEEQPTRPHPDHVRRFERAAANQLWQTDLFTFVLKRQNRRVYLVAFLDDHSRFLTGYGLHGSQSTALVIEVLRAAIAGYGVPAEILTDNGTQYVTWRGKSQFTRELEKLGIRQIVAQAEAAADAGQDRALLGHAVARVRRERGVRGPGQMRGGGSACSSTTTTSSVCTRAWAAWCRPIGSSTPRRRSSPR